MTPTRFVTSGDQQLAVYAWGQPGLGPTLVLVHGYPDSAGVWRPIAEQLALHCHVLAYDVRGCGLSSTPARTEAYRLDYLVQDLAAVIDACSPHAPIHLVAHDWGSIQCWEAVCSDAMQHRIASFTSLSGPSLDHIGHWMRQAAPAKVLTQLAHSWYIGLFQLPGIAPALWRMGLDKQFSTLIARREGAVLVPSEHRRKDGVNGIELYRANVPQRLRRPHPRTCSLPVQLVAATRDPFVTPWLLEAVPEWVPRLWRRDINTGHWGIVSHPTLIADHILSFVRSLESGKESAALKLARVNAASEREFSRKLVLVTGAGSGIGRETALLFAQSGATVIAADLNLETAKATAELAGPDCDRVLAYKVDVSSEKQMQRFAAWVETEFGAPDILVNNAGIGIAGRFFDTSVKDWETVLKVNLWGVIHGARLFGELMQRHGKAGHIVNLASMAAYTPAGFMSAYATSKAAVLMLTDCLRADLAQAGIRVSSICPGLVDTGITTSTRFVGVDDAEAAQRQARAKAKYQQRNLQPGQVAQAILTAVRSNKPDVRVGAEAEAARWMSRWAPALMRRLAAVKVAL